MNSQKMAQEYMLYIRNSGDAKASMSSVEHSSFIHACEVYIGQLKSAGKLIAAQPLLRKGTIITKIEDSWNLISIGPDSEIQVGYYHIISDSDDEAVEIARMNPEFDFVPSASVEIRPVKTIEEETNYVYPK